MDLHRRFTTMVNFKRSVPTERKSQIRTSSVPICPKWFILDNANPVFEESYGMDFYTGIGTSIHSTVQKWFPFSSPLIMFGNWKCLNPDCGKIAYRKLGPLKCKNCGADTGYEEFSMRFIDAPISGHSDGILLDIDPDMAQFINDHGFSHLDLKKNIEAWVLELKSSGTHRIMQKNEKGADARHKLQAGMYSVGFDKILKQKYGFPIDVKGYVIKYLGRDIPTLLSRDFKETPENAKHVYEVTCKAVNLLIKGIIQDKPGSIFKFKPCEDHSDLYLLPSFKQSNSSPFRLTCEYEKVCKSVDGAEFKKIFKEVRKSLFRDFWHRYNTIF